MQTPGAFQLQIAAIFRTLAPERLRNTGKRKNMPNYVQRERDLLGPREYDLASGSRWPAITKLDDTALLRLISDLEAALATASTETETDGLSAAGLLKNALHRARGERRKRGLAATPPNPVKTPATIKAARSGATGTRRVPAGRKKTSKTRKADLRTSQRRAPKPATTKTPKAEPAPAKPALTHGVTEPAPKAVQKTAPKSVRPAPKDAKATKKMEKALKKAEKQARKAVRKMDEKAAKAARKAARKATKEVEKAMAQIARAASKRKSKSKK